MASSNFRIFGRFHSLMKGATIMFNTSHLPSARYLTLSRVRLMRRTQRCSLRGLIVVNKALTRVAERQVKRQRDVLAAQSFSTVYDTSFVES